MKMRTWMHILLFGVLTIVLAGCESSSQKNTVTTGEAGTAGAVDPASSGQPGVVEHSVHDASTQAVTTPVTQKATPPPARPRPRRVVDQGGSKAMGLRTQKPGFVISPYAMYDEPIDVSGLPAGTEVKCPYTGKIFIVP